MSSTLVSKRYAAPGREIGKRTVVGKGEKKVTSSLQFHGTIQFQLQTMQQTATSEEILAVFLRKLHSKLWDMLNHGEPLANRSSLLQLCLQQVQSAFNHSSREFSQTLHETLLQSSREDFSGLSHEFENYSPWSFPCLGNLIERLVENCESFILGLDLDKSELRQLILQHMRKSAQNKRDAMFQLENFKEIKTHLQRPSRRLESIRVCSQLLQQDQRKDPSGLPCRAWIQVAGFLGIRQMFGKLCQLNRSLFKLCHSSLLWNEMSSIQMYAPWFPLPEDLKALFSRLPNCSRIEHTPDRFSNEILQLAVENCPKLKHMDLSGCKRLSESNSLTLCQISSLQSLDISECSFPSPKTMHLITPSFQNSLRVLRAVDCPNLCEKSLKALFICKRLEVLCIPLSSPIPLSPSFTQQLARHCPELAELDLSHRCPEQAADAQILFTALESMSRLTLRHWNGFGEVPYNVSLSYLDLSGSRLRGDGQFLRSLVRNCAKLRVLKVGGCKVSEKSVEEVAEYCRDLRQLDISHSLVSEKGIRALAKHCTRLAHLSVNDCANFTDECIIILSKCLALESLSANNCPSISDVGFGTLANSRLNGTLRKLCLGGSSEFTLLGMKHIRSLKGLKKLHATSCKAVDVDTMLLWGTSSFRYSLQSLDLSHCTNVGEQVLQAVGALLSGLENVSLSACERVNDRSVIGLIHSLRALRNLNVSHCPLLTNACVEPLKNLLEHSFHLQTLDFRGCQGISPDILCNLQHHCIHVTIFGVSAQSTNLRSIH